MIAHIRLNPREIIKVYPAVPAFITHPDNPKSRLVSPVIKGWKGGGELTYADDNTGRIMAVEGPPKYAIVDVIRANPIQAGKRLKGRPVYDLNPAGEVVETVELQDIPEPVVSMDMKMEIDDLKVRLAALEAK